MLKRITIYFLVFLLSSVLNVNVSSASTLDTVSIGDATTFSKDHKCWYVSGRYWAVWGDGTNIVYSSSTDGINWETKTTMLSGIGIGDQGDTWFDGTYIHYAYCSSRQGDDILYRRGTPQSNGVISWSAAEQVAYDTPSDQRSFLTTVCVDTGGYPFIAWVREYDGNRYPWLTKSAKNDGTWETAPGHIYQLSTTADYTWVTDVIPMTNGKVYALYGREDAQLRGRLWDGSVWDSSDQTCASQNLYKGWNFAAVAVNDEIHLTFREKTTQYIKYVNRKDNTWNTGNEINIETEKTEAEPALAKAGNVLYCFFIHGTDNAIYYRNSTNGGKWSNRYTFISEALPNFEAAHQTVYYSSSNNEIGVMYLKNENPPYDIRFKTLPVTTPPPQEKEQEQQPTPYQLFSPYALGGATLVAVIAIAIYLASTRKTKALKSSRING